MVLIYGFIIPNSKKAHEKKIHIIIAVGPFRTTIDAWYLHQRVLRVQEGPRSG